MPFVSAYRVRLDDIDAAGVVFCARCVAIGHAAYEDALAAAGLPLPEVLRAGRIALPLVHVEADFKAPMRHGEDLTVTVTIAALSERSYSVLVGMAGAQGTAATVRQVHAAVDRASGQAIPLPAEVRAALLKLQAVNT